MKRRRRKKRNRTLVLALGMVLALAVISGITVIAHRSSSVNKKQNDSASGKQQKKVSQEAVSEEAVTQEAAEPSEVTPEAAAQEEIQEPEVPAIPESEGARKAYLTFDDGCSTQTDRILDVLAQYGVKATFFVCRHDGEENAARYRRIVAEGHSIGLHSVTHDYKQVYASLDSFIADVEGIRQFVLDTTGVDTHLYRFPGGSSNAVSVVPIEDCIRYLNQNGYRYYDWNIDTSDSVKRHQSVEEMVGRVLADPVSDNYHNVVVLMHDAAYQDVTVNSLPQIIEGLQAKGLEILPITDASPLVQHKKAESVQ